MIKDFLQDFVEAFLRVIRSRLFFLTLIALGLFSVLLVRVFNLQIVQEEYFLNNYIQRGVREVSVSGTRGLIYDKNGEVLAYNELAYAVTIEDVLDSSSKKNEKLNEIIYKTISIIEENGDSINNDFSIVLDSNGTYQYAVSSENERLRFLRDIYGKKKIEELDTEQEQLSNSTAEEAAEFLMGKKKFNIDSEKYDKAMRLKIAIVRYNLSLNSYQKYIATTIASNVSDETVASIYENKADISGVTIAEETIRKYNDSYYFAHIIGYTGKISEDQLSDYNTNHDGDYETNDVVGKSGIESYMESTLQGVKGKQTLFVDSTGRVLDNQDDKEASAGSDVYLTIDKNAQIAAYKILEQKLAGILLSKIVDYDFVADEDSKVIYIPIKDVYFQMINNNVVDLNKFNDKNASENEHNVYSKFSAKQQEVLNVTKQQLNSRSEEALSSLSEEYNSYYSYMYTMLKNNYIVDVDAIDEEDEIFVKWTKEKISFSTFLQYAIANNWINSSKLVSEEESKYSGTDEIYNALIEYLEENLKNDTAFSKLIYKYLIQTGELSGNEVCMLLYDQKVLKYDSVQYQTLASGQGGIAYNFMRKQIEQIKITPAQIALDPCSGSIVVTDTDTGDVVALVTYPSYDNNMLSGSVDAEYWNKLNNDLSLPLYNRATQTRTAPGSTFKMNSAITGMMNGVISPGTQIVDEGQFKELGEPFPKCWIYPGGHGAIDASWALSYSCNFFFYTVGYRLSMNSNNVYDEKLGLSKLEKTASALGLNVLSGVELDENEPIFSSSDAVRSAIGQGSNSFAAVQLARYTNTIANGGNNYELTLIDKKVDAKGKTTNFRPKLTNTVNLDSSVWQSVHQGMRLVITDGTASGTFRGFQVEVAGKSGTAQENKLRSNHTVFVAYAPYENPEISMSVLIPFGDASGYSAEVVKEFMSYYFGYTTYEEVLKGTATVPTANRTGDN